MSRKFETMMECECGCRNPMITGKADYFKPIVGRFTCPDCKSEIIYHIWKKTVTGSAISIRRTVSKPSDQLLLMRAEAAQESREVSAG